MPTEIERQGILRVFFENNPNSDSTVQNESKEMEVPSFFFKILRGENGNFSLQKKGSEDGAEFADITDGQDAEIITLGEVLIFQAAKLGNVALFKACLAAGVDRDKTDGSGNRPLTYAKMDVESVAIKPIIFPERLPETPETPETKAKLKKARIGHREIADLIAGREKDPITKKRNKPQDKFRELAKLVREEYLKQKKEGVAVLDAAIIQGVIDTFGNDIDVRGLTAEDMIAFMEDIVIKGIEGVDGEEKGAPNLNKKPTPSGDDVDSDVQKLLKGKSLTEEEDSDNEGRRKDFYQKLLISCLEHEHHFLSEEHSDKDIRKLIVKNVKKKILEEGGPGGEEEERKGEEEERKEGEKKEKKTSGDRALNHLGQDSVVGLYMRARFNELKKREGLKDDLTYEAFSESLGMVVGINSRLDKEEHKSRIWDASSELKELQEKRKADEAKAKSEALEIALKSAKKLLAEKKDDENWNARERKVEGKDDLLNDEELTEKLKQQFFVRLTSSDKFNKRFVLREADDAIAAKERALKELEDYQESPTYENSVDEVNRALRALLGSTDKKQSGENTDHIAHGDLRLVLKMIREGINFDEEKIVESRKSLNDKAQITLKTFSKGMRVRLNEANALTLKALEEKSDIVLGLKLDELGTDFDIFGETIIEKEDFISEGYSLNAIEEVRGKYISHGNTGLAVHIFSEASGFCEFTKQVADANRRVRTGSDKVSIAHIEDMPNGDGRVKSSYCVAVLSDNGVTKIFSKEIPEISRRSEEVYKENLEFETRREGIDYAIAVLTDARNKLLLGKIFDENGKKVPFGATSSNPKPKVEKELKRLRDELSDQLAGLRKLLKDSEVNPNESPEEMAKKRLKLKENLKSFREDPEGHEFNKILEGSIPESGGLAIIDPEKIKKIKNLIEGHSSEEMRSRARKMTSRQMQGEIAANVKSSMEDGKYTFNLDLDERVKALAAYMSKDLTTFSNRWDKKGRKGFEKLLAEEMPASAYKGISVFRPRGKDNIATVIFNGDEGDDTMYLTLPDTQQCYVRVSRCDYDGNFSVWRQGKKVNEEHKKGDLIIDTGVVFHKEENGKYVTIPYEKLNSMPYGRGVKEAARDFEIKAISVNEGQCLSSAMLYNGVEVSMDLKAKTLPMQKVNSHKPQEKPKSEDVVFKKLGGEILDTGLVVKIGENTKLIISDHDLKLVTNLGNDSVKQESFEEIDDVFKASLKGKLDSLSAVEKEEFKKDFFKHCITQPEIGDDLFEIASELIPEALENASKKYAVINSFEGFDLVVPVKLEGSRSSKAANPDFLSPEIQFEEKGEGETKGELKRMTLDAPGAKEIICSSADRKFLLTFFSEKEMSGKTEKEFLKEEENYEKLCENMKEHCKKASVTVGFQEVKEDGTLNYEAQYKNVGKLETKTFGLNSKGAPTEVKLLADKVEPSFSIAASSGFSGLFKKGGGRIIVKSPSPGRGG